VRALVCGVLLLLIATSCSDAPSRGDDDGALVVVAAGEGRARLAAGDRLALTVEQNASTGDAWELSEPPDLDVARFVGQEYEVDAPDADGSGGTLTFRFDSVGRGETSVRLRNCFQCSASGAPPFGDASSVETRDFEITVTDGTEGEGFDLDDAVVVGLNDRVAEVTDGTLLVVELEQNSSIGDDWQVWGAPDDDVVRLVGATFEADSPEAVGSGGTLRLALLAVGRGEAQLTLHNCYRCDAQGQTPTDDRDLAVDVELEFRVR